MHNRPISCKSGPPVIYAIRNVLNGKRYIGSTSDEYSRCRYHLRLLKLGTHHAIKLQRAWKKYGDNAFVWERVEIAPQHDLLKREQHFLNQKPHYNSSYVAGTRTRLGMKSTKEHRERQSLALKGRVSPNKGKVLSEDHKKAIGRALSSYRKQHPRTGWNHTEAAIEKMRKNHSKKSHPEYSDERKKAAALRTKNWWKNATEEEKGNRLKGIKIERKRNQHEGRKGSSESSEASEEGG